MKKSLILIGLLLSTLITGCGKKEVETLDIQPQETQMKSICELATLNCYYHNVAKYTEKDAEGVLLWKKDRRFWVEYSGIVTIGIDTSKTKIEVNDSDVTITLPPATVMGCKVDENSLNEDSFIVAKDSAKVEAEHQTAAYQDAQSKMFQSASEDKALLENARQRAQKLLEDYVNNIGKCVGKEYNIKWVYSDKETTIAPSTDEADQ